MLSLTSLEKFPVASTMPPGWSDTCSNVQEIIKLIIHNVHDSKTEEVTTRGAAQVISLRLNSA